MIVIEAPNEVYSLENRYNIRMFLAGGITNCPDWQSEVIKKLESMGNLKVTVYNPRRKNFTMSPETEEEQGMWGNSRNIPLLIGIDPAYPRKRDVIIQSKLAGYRGTFSESTEEFCDRIADLIQHIPN